MNTDIDIYRPSNYFYFLFFLTKIKLSCEKLIEKGAHASDHIIVDLVRTFLFERRLASFFERWLG